MTWDDFGNLWLQVTSAVLSDPLHICVRMQTPLPVLGFVAFLGVFLVAAFSLY